MTDATPAPDRSLRERLLARRRSLLAVIFVAAVVVRLVWIFAAVEREPELTGDQKSYDQFATAIVEGHWWDRPVSYREPGYPLVVAVMYAVTGESQTATRSLNALFGALTCLAIYALGRRVFGPGTGLMAAGWFALYFHSVAYAGYLLRESLVTLLLTVMLVTLYDTMLGKRRVRSAVLSGLLYVALVHTDARFLFHAPFIALLLLVATRGGWRPGLSMAVVLFAVFAAGMIPWQLRNYHVYDRIVLVNTRTLVLEAPWRDYSDEKPVEDLQPPPPDSREGVRRLTGARKAIYDLAEFYRAFRFRGEVRNNSNTWEKPWSSFHNWSSILMYGTLIPFFLFGYWRVLRHRITEAYVLVAPVLAHTILHVLKWGRERYRVPVEPALIIVAFYAFVVLYQQQRRRAGGES